MTQPPSALNALRARPIAAEVAAAERAKSGYRAHPVDLQSAEQAQALTDLLALGVAGTNHYHAEDLPPYRERIAGSIPQLYLRTGVAERLSRANARLKPAGLELWVFDAWRPIAVQNHFHDHWMPAYLRRTRPYLTGAALAAEVERYWARGAPDGRVDPHSPPPHATGSAVDLTLRQIGGDQLFMGSIFDDVTAVSNTAHFENGSEVLSFSDIEAGENRRLLYWVMEEQGFANNPSEWWHFSWGDQMWAKITGAPAALYGPVAP